MSQANVELARRGFEAVARGDLEAMRKLLDPVALCADLTSFRNGKVVEMVAFESPQNALAVARA